VIKVLLQELTRRSISMNENVDLSTDQSRSSLTIEHLLQVIANAPHDVCCNIPQGNHYNEDRGKCNCWKRNYD
jgi:hypothetical protein